MAARLLISQQTIRAVTLRSQNLAHRISSLTQPREQRTTSATTAANSVLLLHLQHRSSLSVQAEPASLVALARLLPAVTRVATSTTAQQTQVTTTSLKTTSRATSQ